ncbi:hypothetical protein J1C49_15295 [Cognatishimia sp. F0-27]|nr:hypothetical protein [Cognatishimia sp. F0-27]
MRNERLKLACGFCNAVGFTLIAFALLRPVTEDLSLLTWASLGWVVVGLALHGVAHLMLGKLVRQG